MHCAIFLHAGLGFTLLGPDFGTVSVAIVAANIRADEVSGFLTFLASPFARMAINFALDDSMAHFGICLIFVAVLAE